MLWTRNSPNSKQTDRGVNPDAERAASELVSGESKVKWAGKSCVSSEFLIYILSRQTQQHAALQSVSSCCNSICTGLGVHDGIEKRGGWEKKGRNGNEDVSLDRLHLLLPSSPEYLKPSCFFPPYTGKWGSRTVLSWGFASSISPFPAP